MKNCIARVVLKSPSDLIASRTFSTILLLVFDVNLGYLRLIISFISESFNSLISTIRPNFLIESIKFKLLDCFKPFRAVKKRRKFDLISIVIFDVSKLLVSNRSIRRDSESTGEWSKSSKTNQQSFKTAYLIIII